MKEIIKYGSHDKLEDSLFVRFENQGKYGLKDRNGEIVIPAEYDSIDTSGWAGRGWHIKKEDKWGAVNERGEWIFDCEYDRIVTHPNGGHFLTKNGKVGFCDSSGNMVTDFIYDKLDYQSGSGWKGAIAKLNGKWGCIDNTGEITIPIIYDSVYLGNKGVVRIEKGGKYGFINTVDNISIPIEFESSGFTWFSSSDEIMVKKDGFWGVIDNKGKIVIPFCFDSINIDERNIYRVSKDGVYGIISQDGRELFPFKYKYLDRFDENIAYAKNDEGLYGYVDKEDNVLIDFKYKDASSFYGYEYAAVCIEKEKWGVIDKKGTVVVPMEYHYVSVYRDYALLEMNDDKNYRYLSGYYDFLNGNSLPCVFEKIRPRGRERDGIMVCECWTNKNTKPMILRVDSKDTNSAHVTTEDINSIYKEVADTIKQRLADYIGRPYIMIGEWIFLKKALFPFEIPVTALLIRIPISSLDATPLVEILKKRYRYVSHSFTCKKQKEIEEYAWSIVLDSTTYVYGG